MVAVYSTIIWVGDQLCHKVLSFVKPQINCREMQRVTICDNHTMQKVGRQQIGGLARFGVDDDMVLIQALIHQKLA